MREHTGKYQAIVVSARDPKNQRRITARVPDVLGQTVSEWARPATIVDAPLKPGAMVWITFPNGDLRWPVYHVPNDPKHGRIIPTGGSLSVDGPGPAGVVLDAKVHAKKSNSGYVAMVATAFEIASTTELKERIRPLTTDALAAVKAAPSYEWCYTSDHTSDSRLHVGPLLEDLPEVVQASASTVDTGAVIGILWEAVRTLSAKVELLEQALATANEIANPNTLNGDSG
ncbi:MULTISPECIES: phage baseplate assembly protein V [Streptosporangium]|uniref:Peptidase S74 domain-containing protein n=1 Tax=Streptosporangium brasiliense TaxID=47480 RepID=A0ABT9RME0_9ACTN|nr:phage baseplate assembly protein V [Streptosporangium brasiliense]MDP9870464.1 hypothetical protein [Streptosporangium brasiliense]